MKIRNGFVTNSSSSSFILARKNNVDKIQLRAKIATSSEIDVILEDDYDLFDLSMVPEVEEALKNNDKNRAKECLIDYITNELATLDTDMDLGEWKISGGEVSNDTDSVIWYFLFELGDLDLNDFKYVQVY